MKIAILVARFQTPELHEGHINVIEHAIANSDRVILFLGMKPTLFTLNNPLTFEIRRMMVLSRYPHIQVYSMPDMENDHEWSRWLDVRIAEFRNPNEEVMLYGDRDSFIKNYHGDYKFEHTNKTVPGISSTKMREETHQKIINHSYFRSGIIYASGNKHPTSYQCVDVAVIDYRNMEVLLGKKPGEKLFRFIGGFVDPTDESLELAAKREVTEECGFIETDEYNYIGSFRIDDWRYKDEADKIMTAFFACSHIYGHAKPGDDIAQVEWFSISTLNASQVEPVHHCLLTALQNHMNRKKNS